MVQVKGEHTGVSLCPSCGAPAGEYSYTLEATEEEGGPRLQIDYGFECKICGYKEAMKAAMPLKAAYRLRHLMEPNVKILIERMWLTHLSAKVKVEAAD